jgi:hypothetical protein
MSQNPGVGGQSGEVQPVSTKTPLTALSPTNATVTGTSAQIVASNASRTGLAIINLSSDIIYLAFGSATAVVGSGIALTQKGSVYETSEYDFTISAVNAISSGTSSVVSIQQFQ